MIRRTKSMKIQVQAVQLAAIREALHSTKGNARTAAERLGCSRNALYLIVRRAGVTMEDIRHG